MRKKYSSYGWLFSMIKERKKLLFHYKIILYGIYSYSYIYVLYILSYLMTVPPFADNWFLTIDFLKNYNIFLKK